MPPSAEELERLVRTMAERIGGSLERAGLIARHIENAYLAFEARQETQLVLHVESCLKILHRLCTVVLPSCPFKTGEAIMIGFTLEGTGAWRTGRSTVRFGASKFLGSPGCAWIIARAD